MLRFPIITFAVVLAACSTRPATLQLDGLALGTTWSVQATDLPVTSGADLRRDLESTLAEVDSVMSTYRDDSDLVRFNRSDSIDWVEVPATLAEVVAAARGISELSGGAFDVTVNPLVDLWGFGPPGPRSNPPTLAEIDAVRSRVGYRQVAVRLDPPALRKVNAAVSVDLSAIAKGYAVDRLAAIVEMAGSTNYLVEIGGELRGRGLNARGVPWRIAVERPDAGPRDVQQVMELRDHALATSGDYRNFYEVDGKRYSHTIDPRTAAPVTHELASVTVVAESAMRADALATALLVMGPVSGTALAQQEDLAVVFISRGTDGYTVSDSPAMRCYRDGDCP